MANDYANFNPRNALIAKLLQEGTSTAPIAHWTQGAARLAQALLGGMGAREIDQERQAANELRMNAPGLGPSPMPAEAPPQPAQQPSGPPVGFAPPAPDNVPMTSAPPAAPAAPATFGQRFDAATPPAAGARPVATQPVQQRNTMNIPPEVAAYIRSLYKTNNPQMVAKADALYTQYAKPVETKFSKLDEGTLYDERTGRTMNVGGDRRPLTSPEDRRYHGIPDDDRRPYHEGPNRRLINPPPETRVNMSTVADPILSGVGGQIVKAREGAREVPRQIESIHEARRALDQGAITGVAADWRVTASKIFGLAPDQVANSEVFRSAVGDQVLSSIKALGANPSNTDRDYIEKVKGGNITLDESSLRRILDIQEKYARQSLRTYNSEAARIMRANPEQYRSIEGVMTFEEPLEYAPPSRASAAPPAQVSPATGWQQMPDGSRVRLKPKAPQR
jgi:hypothetical protein